MKLAPIILFTYNRPIHTRKTIETLEMNKWAKESDLFIFSDEGKDEEDKLKVSEVREYLSTIRGFRSVTIEKRDFNYGLAKNVINGVTRIITIHKKVIVVEDDLLTSPFFLQYMNEALELYENENKVLSIHGYIYPIKRKMPASFFLIDPGSLGWGTWKDRWDEYEPDGSKLLHALKQRKLTKEFDYDGTYPFTEMLEDQIKGKNSSWAIRWYAYALLNKKLTLYPGRSLVYHIGNDGSGTHTASSDELDVELTNEPISLEPVRLFVNTMARESFKSYFRYRKNLLRRGVNKLKKIFNNVWDRK